LPFLYTSLLWFQQLIFRFHIKKHIEHWISNYYSQWLKLVLIIPVISYQPKCSRHRVMCQMIAENTTNWASQRLCFVPHIKWFHLYNIIKHSVPGNFNELFQYLYYLMSYFQIDRYLCTSLSATVRDITYTLSTCTTHFEDVGHFVTE
jgi:hypothetical protein